MPAGELYSLTQVDNGNGTFTLITTGGTAPLAAATALATGDFASQDGGTIHGTAIMQVTSGLSVSAGSVQMQGSLDGTNWFNLGTATNTNAASTVFAPVIVTGTAVRYVRAHIATNITGGTVTATVGMAN